MRHAQALSALVVTAVGAMALAAACAGGVPPPAPLDTRNEACRYCRMTVSNQRFAGQIVAPGEEPLFFDDIGCLSGYVKEKPGLPRSAVSYVADHRTGQWVPVATAVVTSVEGLDTPMASHLVAHASPASRDADPAARGGRDVPPIDLFPGALMEGGR